MLGGFDTVEELIVPDPTGEDEETEDEDETGNCVGGEEGDKVAFEAIKVRDDEVGGETRDPGVEEGVKLVPRFLLAVLAGVSLVIGLIWPALIPPAPPLKPLDGA